MKGRLDFSDSRGLNSFFKDWLRLSLAFISICHFVMYTHTYSHLDYIMYAMMYALPPTETPPPAYHPGPVDDFSNNGGIDSPPGPSNISSGRSSPDLERKWDLVAQEITHAIYPDNQDVEITHLCVCELVVRFLIPQPFSSCKIGQYFRSYQLCNVLTTLL